MNTKQAIITLLITMLTVPLLLDAWAHLVLWLGGRI